MQLPTFSSITYNNKLTDANIEVEMKSQPSLCIWMRSVILQPIILLLDWKKEPGILKFCRVLPHFRCFPALRLSYKQSP